MIRFIVLTLCLLFPATSYAAPVWCQSTDGVSINNPGGCGAPYLAAPSPATGWAQFDTGSAAYQAWASRSNSVISSSQFQARFTQSEMTLVGQAALASPAIFAGLVQGLSAGSIDLTGCPAACVNTTLKSWMDGLVAAGAITGARETAILTP